MSNGYIPGTHILWSEYRCRHCGALPPGFYNPEDHEIAIEYMFFFGIYENLRAEYGDKLPWSSGYRCPIHQMNLYKAGLSTTPYSVHMFGLAGDLKCKDTMMAEKIVSILRKLKSKPRIGWKTYFNKPNPWVHFDVGFLITPIFDKKLKRGKEW